MAEAGVDEKNTCVNRTNLGSNRINNGNILSHFYSQTKFENYRGISL